MGRSLAVCDLVTNYRDGGGGSRFDSVRGEPRGGARGGNFSRTFFTEPKVVVVQIDRGAS